MRSFEWKNVIVLTVVLVASVGFVPTVFSEEGAAEETISNRPAYKEKIAELRKLKEENPAEFERVVKERKEKLKERLQELKEKEPAKYEEVKDKMAHRRKEKLQRLREENPEKFREIMENKAEKLKDLKEKNPERYEQFMKNHRGEYRGVRDHGQGIGRGKGQGGEHRSTASAKGGKGPARVARNRY